jgi:hypothetical protein
VECPIVSTPGAASKTICDREGGLICREEVAVHVGRYWIPLWDFRARAAVLYAA